MPVVNRVQLRFSSRVNSADSARSGNSFAFTSADGKMPGSLRTSSLIFSNDAELQFA